MIARFFCLQHEYFYSRGSLLCGCQQAAASLGHFLCECHDTREVCFKHQVPTCPEYLRVFLLTRTGIALHAMLTDYLPLLKVSVKRTLLSPHQPTIETTTLYKTLYEVWWDGSYQQSGAGIGVCIYKGPICILEVAMPVNTSDACRTEAFGPPLIAALLQVLPRQRLMLRGDSQYIC